MQVLGRPVRFLLAGAWNTVFGLALFTVLQLSIGDQVGYAVTLAIAQAVAVAQAHLVQRLLVWRSREPYLSELLRFSVIYAVVYAVNVTLLGLVVETALAPVLPAQYVIGAVLILVSYFVQRRWTFRTGQVHRDNGASEPAIDLGN